MTYTVVEIVWIKQLLHDITIPIKTTHVLHCDNQSALALVSNPVLHSRAKHIEIDCHFVREQVTKGIIKLASVTSEDNVADLLTKDIGSAQFDSDASIYSLYWTDGLVLLVNDY